MKSIIPLLVCLRRHEFTARAAKRQMSPGEKSTLKTQLALVRGTIPDYVLKRYDQLKRSKFGLQESPVLLAMATLVYTYQALPARKRRDLTSCIRNVPPEVGRHEYRFVVDGKWMDDHKAREFVPNPQGGQNAVLQIVDRRYES